MLRKCFWSCMLICLNHRDCSSPIHFLIQQEHLPADLWRSISQWESRTFAKLRCIQIFKNLSQTSRFISDIAFMSQFSQASWSWHLRFAVMSFLHHYFRSGGDASHNLMGHDLLQSKFSIPYSSLPICLFFILTVIYAVGCCQAKITRHFLQDSSSW